MEKNIFTDFFDFIGQAIQFVLGVIGFIVIVVLQIGFWIMGLVFSIWILKIVLDFFGIHLGIGL